MKQWISIVMIVTLMAVCVGCTKPAASPAQTSAPQDVARTTATPAATEENAPTPTPEVLQVAQRGRNPWYLADGRNIIFVNNDGIYAMNYDGGNVRCIDNGAPDEFAEIWVQSPGTYLVKRWLNDDRASSVWRSWPQWMKESWSEYYLYDLYRLNDKGGKIVLAAACQPVVTLSDGSILYQTGEYPSKLMLLNTSGTSAPVELPTQECLINPMGVKGDTAYLSVLTEGMTWEDREIYTLKNGETALTKIDVSAVPSGEEMNHYEATSIADMQAAPVYQDDGTALWGAQWDGQAYTVSVDTDDDWTGAAVTLYRGAGQEGEMLQQAHILALSGRYSYEEYRENTLKFLLEKQAADGELYTNDIERIEVDIVGGWAFVSSNGYTNGVIGGPSQLIVMWKLT
ncbi:MAG: hypothetical protein PHD32_00275 [Eubacteriales bacterium]|nr:hypothetical protein [Eubacteriales bacterium]